VREFFPVGNLTPLKDHALDGLDRNSMLPKSKLGPKPKYRDRASINLDIPKRDLEYIRSVSSNTTEWIIQAIKDKRERSTEVAERSKTNDNA
jgi:hypothetical protein